MAWTKAKTAIVVGAIVLLAASTTTMMVKQATQSNNVERYFRTIGIPMTNGVWSEFDKIPPNFLVLRDTHYADFQTSNGITGQGGKDRAIGRNLGFSQLMKFAYNFYFPHSQGTGVVLPADAPQDGYDFLATGTDALSKLRAKITRQLGYTASIKMQNTDVYLLTIKNTNAPGLKPSNGYRPQNGLYDWSAMSPDMIAFFLEPHFDLPILNQTGLNGQYDVQLGDLAWDYSHPDESRAKLLQTIRDRLGLELTKTNMPIEMLVVEKVQ